MKNKYAIILNAEERQLILDSFNGVYFSNDIPLREQLCIGINDSCDLNHLDQKHQVNKIELLVKICDMNEEEINELVEDIQVFWKRYSKPTFPLANKP